LEIFQHHFATVISARENGLTEDQLSSAVIHKHHATLARTGYLDKPRSGILEFHPICSQQAELLLGVASNSLQVGVVVIYPFEYETFVLTLSAPGIM
jgi:hypothetical protein